MATTKIHSNRHLHCKDNNYLIFFISYQIRVCKYLNKIKYKKVKYLIFFLRIVL